MKRNKNAVKGFTLIELVIVMALLAILAALGVYTFAGVRSSAADDAAYKKLDSIEDAFLYSRTTNGYDNDKAIKNVDTLVSVEGTYTIDAKDDHYKIVYTENNKDYIAENDLYSYSKPGDSGGGEGGGGSGGGGGGGGTTDPDNPDNPDNPDKPLSPEEQFIKDSSDLFLNTAEISDLLGKLHGYAPDGNWINALNQYIKENDIKDADGNTIVIESNETHAALNEFISKFYYNGDFPVVSNEILKQIGGFDPNKEYYLRPKVDYSTVDPDPNSIVLYVSPNKEPVDNEITGLIFIGERKFLNGEPYVEGYWYCAPVDPAQSNDTYFWFSPNNLNRSEILAYMSMLGWDKVKLDIKL